jgi:hypothetical protein
MNQLAKKQNLIKATVIFIFCLMILLLSKDIGFFWDNVLLSSIMGHYLYDNGLFSINFPIAFDPGHPPLMAFLHAFVWKYLGKTLFVSHLITLPFLFGFIWQLHLFISHFTQNKRYQIIAILFVLGDPTIVAQFFFIGQELPQLFLFLLATNQLLEGKYFFKAIALFFLGICSLRGMMLCGGFFIFEVFYNNIIQHNWKHIFNKKNIAAYFFGASASIAFLCWRLMNKGWIQTHEGSPWEDLWHIANLKTIGFNIIILIHRFLDFGRVVVVLFIVVTAFYRYKNKLKFSIRTKLLFSLTILSTCIITIVSIAATNTIAHRYYAISFVFMHLLALHLLNNLIKCKKGILVVLYLFLITGNIWQYPHKIAQGWDASLRGLPYFRLRNKAINYLNESHIKIEDTGTFFPNNFSLDEISLNGDNRKFQDFDSTNNYVLYANVYNISNEQYKQLEQQFIVIKKFEQYGIYIDILKKR